MRESRAATALLCLGVLIAGCRGSSGERWSGGGGLAIAPAAISFQVKRGDPLPAPQSIQLTITAPDAVHAGVSYLPSKPAWLSATLAGSGSDVSVLVQLTAVPPPGTHQAVVRIGIRRADDSTITTRDAAISVIVADTLTASPSTLSFDAVAGGPAPEAKQVAVEGSGLGWTVAASEPWIQASPASGTSPSTLAVSVDPAGLAPGLYTGTVTLARNGTTEDATVDVSLDVAAPVVQASPANLAFAGVNGSAIASATVDVAISSGASEAWTATAADPWVVLQPSTGTTPATLTVSVDPSQGPLASGDHTSTITITSTAGGVTLTRDVPVSLELTLPVLSVSPASLTLGGTLGRDLSPAQVLLALKTAPLASVAWTATGFDGVALDASAGTVGSAGATVTVGPDAAAVPAGLHQGDVTFTASINGDVVTATLPVTLRLDARRLLASDTGVAFAATGGGARLTRTLSVRDTFAGAIGWTASADAAWLEVSPSGTTPGEVTIQAVPPDLATDTLLEGTVTLTPDDPAIPAETIRVGFWNGTAGQGARSVTGPFYQVETDPIRPYAYVHSGGPDIRVYNVYTGALVKTFSRVAPTIGALAASHDGAWLYAEDVTNLRVIPIDLATGAAGTGWSIGSYAPKNLAYTRTDGTPVLFAGYGCAHRADTGAALNPSNMYRWCDTMTATSVAGNRICGTDTNSSPHDLYCRSLAYDAIEGRLVAGAQLTAYTQGYNGDIALDPAGARVYVGQGYSGAWDAATMAKLQTFTGPRNFEVTRDGRVVAASNGTYPAPNLIVMDAAGFTLGSYHVGGDWIADSKMKVTGDGMCVAALTGNSGLVFQFIGP